MEGMIAQECECNLCHRTVHLMMVKTVNHHKQQKLIFKKDSKSYVFLRQQQQQKT